ncbi:MAG: hypothetical protein JNM99_16775 [Verrucomicrobiaceae bacterium]|nr:hypothetical protein [Verrucomicrobiaceae bacterium]
MKFTTSTPRLRVEVPPPPEHGIHLWLPSAARVMQRSGHTEREAIDFLHAQETGLRRPYQAGEVERAVALIFGTTQLHHGGNLIPRAHCAQRRPDIRFKPDLLARVAAELPEATANWFKARSPLPVENRGPERFLHAITNAGERVLCFTEFKSQGQCLWRSGGGLCLTNGPLSKWCNGLSDGAWFLPQPVTGEWLELDRLKSEHNPTGRTRRAEECVTSFRFALIESDEAEPAQWLSALAQLPLPIVSVVTSGGKSIHALILVNAANKAAWDDFVRGDLLAQLARIGADPAALTAVRLTRLPFIHRGERLQELLFLNPEPSCTPIANLQP